MEINIINGAVGDKKGVEVEVNYNGTFSTGVIKNGKIIKSSANMCFCIGEIVYARLYLRDGEYVPEYTEDFKKAELNVQNAVIKRIKEFIKPVSTRNPEGNRGR